MNPRRFTMVEMLIVVAIIAILAALLSPALQKALGNAKSLMCLNNLKQQGMGMNMYVGDYRCYPWTVNPTPSHVLFEFNDGRGKNLKKMQDYWAGQIFHYVGGVVSLFNCPAEPTSAFVEGYGDHKTSTWETANHYGINVGRGGDWNFLYNKTFGAGMPPEQSAYKGQHVRPRDLKNPAVVLMLAERSIDKMYPLYNASAKGFVTVYQEKLGDTPGFGPHKGERHGYFYHHFDNFNYVCPDGSSKSRNPLLVAENRYWYARGD